MADDATQRPSAMTQRHTYRPGTGNRAARDACGASIYDQKEAAGLRGAQDRRCALAMRTTRRAMQRRSWPHGAFPIRRGRRTSAGDTFFAGAFAIT
ncbi:MAG: hypothetical protein ACK5MY_08065 [Jhaorihella sp.]